GDAPAGATAGALDAESWKEDFGISDDFVQRVGTMVQPGDSAIFALLRSLDPGLVADQFRGYGGTILRTTLNPVQHAKVGATLAGRQRRAPTSAAKEQRQRRGAGASR